MVSQIDRKLREKCGEFPVLEEFSGDSVEALEPKSSSNTTGALKPQQIRLLTLASGASQRCLIASNHYKNHYIGGAA